MKCYVILVLLWISSQTFAQIRIEGKVLDESGKPFPYAQILVENTSVATVTDEKGFFSVAIKGAGTYTLIISYLGFTTYRKLIEAKPGTLIQIETIQLQPSKTSLSEVVVTGKTAATLQEQQPIVVDVLDLTQNQQKSSSLTQLLNLSSGIKVRQASGVGSETSININGMQGKAIRFFRDGIPTDYLGKAFQLSLIPVSNLDRVEVYKGVLPTELGSDALGGAVNLVSKKLTDNELDVSYTVGSFNTHEFSVQSYLNVLQKKAYFSTSSYYVHSDNDYHIDAKVVDPGTRNLQAVRVRRFHDKVTSVYLSGKVGLAPNRWLDQAEAEAGYLHYTSDFQHNLYMSQVYGEVGSKEQLFQANVLLAKRIKNKLYLNLFSAYSRENNHQTDTTLNKYNWFGEATRGNASRGEINGIPSLQVLNYHTIYTRFVGSLSLHENHTLEFSHNLQLKSRIGENPLGQKIIGTDIDPISIRATYSKNISGLGLQSEFLGKRLVNIFTLKYYSIATAGVDMFYSYSDKPQTTSQQNLGFANSIKFNLTETSFIRASFERATRIPDAEEYFGNGFSVRGNLELKPEQSNNLNVGYSATLFPKAGNKIDVNFFFRGQENLVVLIPWLPFAQYENWANARVVGLELSNTGKIISRLKYAVNLTYQNLRRTGISDISEQALLNSRLPNIPFFYGSGSLDYTLPSLFSKNDKLNLYGNYYYTLQYYLYSIPKALEPANIFSKASIISDLWIPTQHIIDIGASYTLSTIPLSLNVEMNNATDANLYDRFKVQKPGRNFKIKLLYKLK